MNKIKNNENPFGIAGLRTELISSRQNFVSPITNMHWYILKYEKSSKLRLLYLYKKYYNTPPHLESYLYARF